MLKLARVVAAAVVVAIFTTVWANDDDYPVFLTCCNVAEDHSDLPFQVAVNVDSQNACIAQCACHAFKFAGLEKGHECWCGDEFCDDGSSGECDLHCNNGMAGCGGATSASIYSVGSEACKAIACSSTDYYEDSAAGYAWCDASLSLDDRVEALLGNLTLPEKAGLFVNGASGVPRLGIPAYNW